MTTFWSFQDAGNIQGLCRELTFSEKHPVSWGLINLRFYKQQEYRCRKEENIYLLQSLIQWNSSADIC